MEKEARAIIKAKNNMSPIGFVMVKLPIENNVSGIEPTRNFRVRKTAINDGTAKMTAAL